MNTASALRQRLGSIKRAVLRQPDPRLDLLKRLPRAGIGAEIGVWGGDFSHRIVKVTDPRELHLIDPWEFQGQYPDRMYGGRVAKSQTDMDFLYESVRDWFRRRPQVILHRGYSETVLQEFQDGYFDWVYIDGNHYYEHVRIDLQLSFLKVKPGGLITGDDWLWGAKDGYPVQRAVHELLEEHGLVDKLEILSTQYLIRR